MNHDTSSLIEDILRRTKEGDGCFDCMGVSRELLKDLGVRCNDDDSIVISREKRIELAMSLVERGRDIVDVIDLLTWKDFEGLVANILSENGFQCIESFRRRGNKLLKGMEIDVIGIRGRCLLVIDAKMWGIRGGKSSAVRFAAEKQKERTGRLLNQRAALAKQLPLIVEGEFELYPIIVTWMVEEVEIHEGVPVVPVFKFNQFILDFEQYRDIIVSFRGTFS